MPSLTTQSAMFGLHQYRGTVCFVAQDASEVQNTPLERDASVEQDSPLEQDTSVEQGVSVEQDVPVEQNT